VWNQLVAQLLARSRALRLTISRQPPADLLKRLMVPSRYEHREHPGTRRVTLGSRKATFPGVS
jgi:hypothetical protein